MILTPPPMLQMPCPNHWAGRGGYHPRYIITHGTAGQSQAQDIAGYFNSTSCTDNPVSSHFVIGTDGTIVQCVQVGDSAWANGAFSAGHAPWWNEAINPNLLTISIEHCKTDLQNANALTPAQQASSLALNAWLCQTYNIPTCDADASGGITGHFSIDPINRSNCPGTYPWDALWSYLQSTPATEDDTMLQLTDPMGSYYTSTAADVWTCQKNNLQVRGAILVYYRIINGAPRLVKTAEQTNIPGVVWQEYECGILVYDPTKKLDNPPNAHNYTYMVKLDSDLAKQISGYTQLQADYLSIINEKNGLVGIKETLTAEIVKLQVQLTQTQPSSAPVMALQAQITALEGKLIQIETLAKV